MLEKNRVSIRARLREWLGERIEGLDKVDLAALVAEAAEDLSEEKEFVHQFLAEALYPHLAHESRLIMAKGRGGPRRKVIEAGGVLQSEEAFEEEARASLAWDPVWVHARGQYFRLPRMTKPLLEDHLAEARPRHRTERVDRRFKFKLKAGLPDDVATVEQTYAPEEMRLLWQQAESEVDHEMQKEERTNG